MGIPRDLKEEAGCHPSIAAREEYRVCSRLPASQRRTSSHERARREWQHRRVASSDLDLLQGISRPSIARSDCCRDHLGELLLVEVEIVATIAKQVLMRAAFDDSTRVKDQHFIRGA